ncbi:hypothetical protein BAE44_0026398, partial [Dichanthelium oligosanthes]
LPEDATELERLPTKMRRLNGWYKGLAKNPTVEFGVTIPKDTYHQMSGSQLWVPWECLFQLFAKRDLDVQLLSLWTMIISFLCSMEAHQCKLEKKTHIAFLDPMISNENTCKGINGDPSDNVARLAKVF